MLEQRVGGEHLTAGGGRVELALKRVVEAYFKEEERRVGVICFGTPRLIHSAVSRP